MYSSLSCKRDLKETGSLNNGYIYIFFLNVLELIFYKHFYISFSISANFSAVLLPAKDLVVDWLLEYIIV